MLKDITLGQYYPSDSVLHRLDPRVKLVATFLYIIVLFIVNNFIGYLIAGIFLLSMIILSKVPVKYMLRGMKSLALLIVIAGIFNIFSVKGTVLLSFWKLSITLEGILMALRMIVRLVFLITSSSIMTLTTTPNQLTDGLETIMRPLKVIKVPVHEISMMMSIALRFIPILMEETDKIMKAQMARGVDFEGGNILVRVKNMVPLLVPLFVAAFRRANDLALAMEARCYRGGDGRTKMKPLKYKRIDLVAYLILIAFTVISILLGRMNILSGLFI